MNNFDDLIKDIGKNKIDNVFYILDKFLEVLKVNKNSEIQRDIKAVKKNYILIISSYNALKNNYLEGIINLDDYNKELNNVKKRIYEFIEDIRNYPELFEHLKSINIDKKWDKSKIIIICSLILSIVAISLPVMIHFYSNYQINKNEIHYFLLSSNAGDEDTPWVNTNISVNEGDSVIINASGRINLAIHHIIHAAETDSVPILPWNGPNGLGIKSYPNRQYRIIDTKLTKDLLDTSLNHGRLIGILSKKEPPIHSKNIFDIGENRAFQIKNSSGYIWLSINEIWLTPNSKDTYSRHDGYDERTKQEKALFFDKYIKDKRYWNIWYDDNCGSFLVSIQVIKK